MCHARLGGSPLGTLSAACQLHRRCLRQATGRTARLWGQGARREFQTNDLRWCHDVGSPQKRKRSLFVGTLCIPSNQGTLGLYCSKSHVVMLWIQPHARTKYKITYWCGKTMALWPGTAPGIKNAGLGICSTLVFPRRYRGLGDGRFQRMETCAQPWGGWRFPISFNRTQIPQGWTRSSGITHDLVKPQTSLHLPFLLKSKHYHLILKYRKKEYSAKALFTPAETILTWALSCFNSNLG